jgi:hypothetical protein
MGRKLKFPIPMCEDEAFFYAVLNTAPLRPRNTLERNARGEVTGRSKPGRPPYPTSRSQGAMDVAQNLVDVQGFSRRSAAEEAAKMFGLKSPDNIRRQLRLNKRRSKVTLKSVGLTNNFWGGLGTAKVVPSFLGVIDMSTGEVSQATNDPEGLAWLKQQASHIKFPKN